MRNFDELNPDQVDDEIDQIIDEIEQEEMRLKKQEVMFKVIEQDQAYYQSLIQKTNTQISQALGNITELERQLEHERKLKEYKQKFEELATQLNKFEPQ